MLILKKQEKCKTLWIKNFMKKTKNSIESICKTWNTISFLLFIIILLPIMFTEKSSINHLVSLLFWISYGNLLLSQITINIFFVQKIDKMVTALLASSLLLVIAVAPLSYIYYYFLRLAISVIASINAFELYKKNKYILLSIFVLIIILYNPIFIIHLEKSTWTQINLFTSLFFGVFSIFHTNEVVEDVEGKL
jgi:hypothetical protein